jgi:bifunctional DNA-binding transcriptional regulator/antitoxin component of YhaV-PrlF toxin-antitoxin module
MPARRSGGLGERAGLLQGNPLSPYISVPTAPDRAMNTLTVTAKGKVTLRKEILEHLGVDPGEKVAVEKLPNGRIEMKAARPAGRISDVFNFLKTEDGPSLSIEKINKVAAQG